VVYLLLIAPAWSAPTCGTILPGKKRVEWGLALNTLFKYSVNNSTTKADLRSEQLFLTLAYGIFDWLALDGKIGLADLRNDKSNHLDIDYDFRWGGGYGFRIKAYENPQNNTRLILGVHHISVHPASEMINSTRYKAIFDDNQIDAIFAKEYGLGIPYAGCKVSKSRLLRRDNTNDSSLHSHVRLGVILGYDYRLPRETYINIESRFIDETAFTVGVSHIF